MTSCLVQHEYMIHGNDLFSVINAAIVTYFPSYSVRCLGSLLMYIVLKYGTEWGIRQDTEMEIGYHTGISSAELEPK